MMKHLSLVAIGLPVTLWVSLAVAQSPGEVMQQPSTEYRDPFVPPAKEVSVTLDFKDVDVIALLRKISLEGNVEVIVRGNVSGKIKQVEINKSSPERAVEKIAQLAGLDWKLENKTYIISQKSPVAIVDKVIRINLAFVDTPVATVLKTIGQASNTQVTVSADVTERLQMIRLTNETPEDAIKKIAQAANLTWHKGENNNYTITKPEPGA